MTDDGKRIIYMTESFSPTSQAVQVGNTLYISGQFGLLRNTNDIVQGGAEAETHQALLNLQEILYTANCSYRNVVKMTIIMTNLKDMNKIYQICREFLNENSPAMTYSQAGSLPQNAKVEIDAVAVLGKGLDLMFETRYISSRAKPLTGICIYRDDQKEINLPPDLTFEVNEQIVVTYVVNPSLFYVRQAAKHRTFLEIKNILTTINLEVVEDVYVGQYVCRNGSRMQVLGTEGNLIRFVSIDTGYQGVTDCKVFHLPNCVKHFPPLAKKCGLRYIEPGCTMGEKSKNPTWSNRAVTDFHNLMLNSGYQFILSSFVRNEDHCQVEIHIPSSPGKEHHGSVSVGDILIFKGLAVSTPDKPEETRQFPYLQIPFSNTEEHNVFLTYVIDPHCFYIRPSSKSFENHVHEHKSKFQENAEENLSKKNLLLVPAVNQACLVSLPEDIARGVITKVYQDFKVEVLLVDCGKTMKCSVGRIRMIPKEFLKIPCLARKAMLYDVEPPANTCWSEEVTKVFYDIAKGPTRKQKKVFRMVVEDEMDGTSTLVVSLYDDYKDLDICLNALLIKIGIAESQQGFHLQVNFPKGRSHQQRTQGKFHSKQLSANCVQEMWTNIKSVRQAQCETLMNVAPPEKIFVKDAELKCRITEIHSPLRIFLMPEEYFLKELELRNMITVEVKSKGELLVEPSLGQLCFARTSLGNFSRGVILAQVNDKRWRIYLQDTGKVEVCSKEDLYKISEGFKNIPDLVVPVHLSSVIPAGGGKRWSVTALEYLKKAVEANCSTITVRVQTPAIYVIHQNKKIKSVPVIMVYQRIDIAFSKEEAIVSDKWIDVGEHWLVKKGLALRRSHSEKEETVFKRCLTFLKSEELEYFQPETDFTNQRSGESNRRPIYRIRENFTWQVRENPLNTSFTGKISNISMDGCLYIQCKEEHYDALRYIQDGLQCRFKNSISRKTDQYLNVGEPVIAQKPFENKWYRGHILKVDIKERKAMVELVDYGDQVWCTHLQLRKHLAFCEIPLQRFRAKLDCYPAKKMWDRYALDLLKTNLGDDHVTMEVKQFATADGSQDLIVSITLPNGKDASSLLVENKLAKKFDDPIEVTRENE